MLCSPMPHRPNRLLSVNLGERLDRWGDYYYQPAHRGDLYDIMQGVILPFLKQQLKDETLERFRLGTSRQDYLRKGGNLGIYADTFVMELYGGAGAGSYAPPVPQKRNTGPILVLGYNGNPAFSDKGQLTPHENRAM
jgi:hypothetical protein